MRARRLAAAVACAALVGLTAPPAPVGAEAPLPRQEGRDAVTVRGVDQTPWVTREGMWNLTLAVDGAPAGSTVTADLFARVDDADEYARSVLGVIDGEALPSIPDVPVDDAARRPDGSRSVSLAVSLRQQRPGGSNPGWLFLSAGLRPGVYPVDIRVRDADGAELARVVAHITRVPSGDEEGAADAPVTVAPVVDLGAGPTVGPDGEPRRDPGIGDAVADLTQAVRVAPDLPLTLVPRPESIEGLVRDDEQGRAVAALRGVARSRQVVDGPYVEVPLGPWVDLGLTEELTRQRERGNAILTEHLGRVDSSTWDARGGLTPAAAAALWPVGVRTAILSPGALGPAPVTGPATIAAGPGRTLEAVVPDEGLARALTWRGDPVLDAAGVAAELALRATATDGPQGVVVTPTARWLADPAAVARVSQALLDPDAPVRVGTLAELLESVPSTGPRDLAAAMPTDLGELPERLGLARARLSSYASLVGAARPEIATLDQLLLLSGSTALTPDERSRYVESVLAITDDRFGDVRAPARQTVTLTSSDGDVPLTLFNELDEPVTVTVDLRANSRVEIRGFSATQQLQPGRNRLPIQVHTRAPGDSTIDITVRTPDGEVVVDEVRFTVRSTAVPGVGVVLSIGAIAFLLVWWARHWLRDRRGRHGDGGGSDGGGGPDDPGAGPDEPTGGTEARPPALVPA